MKTKSEKTINIMIYILQLVASIIAVYILYSIQLIPTQYLYIFAGLLLVLWIGEYFLIFYKKPKSKRSIITQVLSVILSVLLIVASFFGYQMGTVVDLLSSDGFQTRTISVIVLKDSSIGNINQLPHHDIGYVSNVDEETMTYAIDALEKEVNDMTFSAYQDFASLEKALYNKEVDAIVLDEAFRPLIEEDNESFQDDTRVIYQITKSEESVTAKNVDVLNKPFLVYVSGNDMYGDIVSVSRSDVNMLAAINPSTHQILLISIPRDTYYPLSRNGQLDKFTHTGIYGLQESIDTLQNMMEEEVNYYVRMNFTSFMSIIDAIGGITIDSPHEFTTKIGHYHIKEGINELDAKQALAFVRERKSFADGDFERGRNQQRMISAVIQKVCSPAILTSFSSVLDAVSGSIETNLSTSDIQALVKMQLSDMPSWDVQNYQINGTPDSQPCYSEGGQVRSVIIPDASSIEQARVYIDQLLAGESISVETTETSTQ